MTFKRSLSRLSPTSLAALGVVFGDIGTSPVYTFRQCFDRSYGLVATHAHVLGILSLMVWALIVIVAGKYVLFIMRADNQGEGGILALLALALGTERKERRRTRLIILGLLGAALFYGDSVITPAISVLSAVEGLQVAAPAAKGLVLPLTVVILIALFLFQSRGTADVGRLFGPVMVAWFAVIGLIGLVSILHHSAVLAALNPVHAVRLFATEGWTAFFVLGAVALVFTGGEALYADMGHFGARPIRVSWFAVVLPALVLNYFGQGSEVLNDPASLDNPFFRMVPGWALYPMVALTTAATVIASQAVISGAYSLSYSAMQLGIMPQLDVRRTSEHSYGQVYVPQINWILLVCTLTLVVAFGSSDRLADAYGFAVTGTMTVTTLLAAIVVRKLWHWPTWLETLVILPIFAIDLCFFSATSLKIPSGGWIPLIIGIAIFTVMATWRRGRLLINEKLRDRTMTIEDFVRICRVRAPAPVSGIAVFLSPRGDTVPVSLLHNLKHNKVLHEHVLIVTVVTEPVPRIAPERRLEVTEMGRGIYRVYVRFGFVEQTDVPLALRGAPIPGIADPNADISYFIGRIEVFPKAHPGMALWRERLYVGLARVATRSTEFFRIPIDRAVEVGIQVEI